MCERVTDASGRSLPRNGVGKCRQSPIKDILFNLNNGWWQLRSRVCNTRRLGAQEKSKALDLTAPFLNIFQLAFWDNCARFRFQHGVAGLRNFSKENNANVLLILSFSSALKITTQYNQHTVNIACPLSSGTLKEPQQLVVISCNWMR